MGFEYAQDNAISKWISLGGKNGEGVANPTEVEGILLEMRPDVSKFTGQPRVNYILRTSQGVVAVSGTKYLENEFKKSQEDVSAKYQGTLIGTLVHIKYTGQKPSGKGHPMKTYKVGYDHSVTEIAVEEPDEDGFDEAFDDEDDTGNLTAFGSVYPPESQKPALAASSARAKADAFLKSKKASK